MFLRLLKFPLSLICLQLPLLFHLTFPLEKSSGSMGSFHLIQTIKSDPLRTQTALCDQLTVISAAASITYLQYNFMIGIKQLCLCKCSPEKERSRSGSSQLFNGVRIVKRVSRLNGIACVIKVMHMLKYFVELDPLQINLN